MGAVKEEPIVRTSKNQTRSTFKDAKLSGASALKPEHTGNIHPNPCKGNQKIDGLHIVRDIPRLVPDWLEHLPNSLDEFEDINKTPLKGAQAQIESIGTSEEYDSGIESLTSSDNKYSAYESAGYEALLESKNSFMKESKTGIMQKEQMFCKKLLKRTNRIPEDPLFGEHSSRFLETLQKKSEFRVRIDLHPRLVPSAELLSLLEPNKISNLIEGCNDRWTKAIPFCKKLPQPDRTIAYVDQAFTEQQQRKIGLVYGQKSLFSVREGMCFPFFTCEVKCGTESLTLADRSNANSMTIAVRAVVELYRRAGQPMEIHRRILGFSMSHDNESVRIYGHYPEIQLENTTYYRHQINTYNCFNGEERWMPSAFMYNLYTQFAPKHLDSIREMIDRLPDPSTGILKVAANLVDTMKVDSQGNASAIPAAKDQVETLRPGALRSGVSFNAQLQACREAAKAREEALTDVIMEQSEKLKKS